MKRTPTPITHPPRYVGHQKCLSIVDLLKRPWVSKGARSLDYDSPDIREVQSLLPAFDGNVLFELPPVDTSTIKVDAGYGQAP
jgi:hypothetical protein